MDTKDLKTEVRLREIFTGYESKIEVNITPIIFKTNWLVRLLLKFVYIRVHVIKYHHGHEKDLGLYRLKLDDKLKVNHEFVMKFD